jgi:hypothetical protein
MLSWHPGRFGCLRSCDQLHSLSQLMRVKLCRMTADSNSSSAV